MTAFPVTRLRRLRRTETLRALVRETQLSLDDVPHTAKTDMYYPRKRSRHFDDVPRFLGHVAILNIEESGNPKILWCRTRVHEP